ncbi:MAG: DegV family EDD domain-containing protein [Chloroflexi bacterium]|nr:DegV family EDD domain-containing protein [Chloroflexota bacterium]
MLKTFRILPKTAPPLPTLGIPIFEEISKKGDSTIVLIPSKKVSGNFRSVIVAAQDFSNTKIHVIEMQLIGTALGTIVRKTVDWINEGVCFDQILENIKQLRKRVKIYFYVAILEFLHICDRIGPAKTFFGSVFQIKPILLFNQTEVNQFGIQPANKRPLERIVELVSNECPHSFDSYPSIFESDALEESVELQHIFSPFFKINDINICDLPPAIIVYAGPVVIAASYFS